MQNSTNHFVSTAEQLAQIKRGCFELIDEKELIKKLERKIPLRIKAGFDPTAPDLHLGHTVLIHKLRHFQELGHQVVFLIGDFTGMIGDPSGRSETRPALTQEQVLANAETYKNQVFKILDPAKTEVAFNSTWMNAMTPADFIRLASHHTVARMLERDDFQRRYESEQPIALHEFLYPLVQGYDSVALKADVELGGTDQKFNLLVGRSLQTSYGQEPQCVLTMPLLEGTDGVRKMSKSFGNYVGIAEPAREIFGKLMSISDELMWRYYELLSNLSLAEITALQKKVASGEAHPKTVKEDLAFEITTRYHGEAEATVARQGFNAVFAGGAMPEDMPELTCNFGEDSLPAVCLEKAALVQSRGEARRLIAQGALTVSGERWNDANEPLPKGEHTVRLGKKRFAKIIVV